MSADYHGQAAPEQDRGHHEQRRKTKQGQAKKKQSRSKVQMPSNDSDQDEEDAEGEARLKNKAEGLLNELRCGSAIRSNLAVASFVSMAFQDTESSRAAQLALELASATEQVDLAFGFNGLVLDAMQNKNANYTVTKMVEVMPVDRIGFIVKELTGHGSMMAKHRFGCRILCRILEHLSPRDENSMNLLNEVLEDAQELCIHAFGSIVIRHVLEHGLDKHRAIVAMALRQSLLACAAQRKGSHVVEAAFTYCSASDCHLLADELLRSHPEFLTLAKSQFGRHVIVAMLQMDGDISQQVLRSLMPYSEELSASKNGRLVHLALVSDGKPSSSSRL